MAGGGGFVPTAARPGQSNPVNTEARAVNPENVAANIDLNTALKTRKKSRHGPRLSM